MVIHGSWFWSLDPSHFWILRVNASVGSAGSGVDRVLFRLGRPCPDAVEVWLLSAEGFERLASVRGVVPGGAGAAPIHRRCRSRVLRRMTPDELSHAKSLGGV